MARSPCAVTSLDAVEEHDVTGAVDADPEEAARRVEDDTDLDGLRERPDRPLA